MYIHHCGAFPEFPGRILPANPFRFGFKEGITQFKFSPHRKIPNDPPGWLVQPCQTLSGFSKSNFLVISPYLFSVNSILHPIPRRDFFPRSIQQNLSQTYIYIIKYNYIYINIIPYFQTNTSITSTTPSPTVSHRVPLAVATRFFGAPLGKMS